MNVNRQGNFMNTHVYMYVLSLLHLYTTACECTDMYTRVQASVHVPCTMSTIQTREWIPIIAHLGLKISKMTWDAWIVLLLIIRHSQCVDASRILHYIILYTHIHVLMTHPVCVCVDVYGRLYGDMESLMVGPWSWQWSHAPVLKPSPYPSIPSPW